MQLSWFYFLEFTAIFILLGWAIYIVFKNGQLNNMPIATMAIGAYLYAYLAKELHWQFGLALLAAIVAGAFLSFILALSLGRAPAFSVAIGTIAMIMIIQTILRNTKIIGGESGFWDIPRVNNLFLITCVIMVIIGFFIYRLERSKIGRAMDVVFVDPDMARALGINTYWLSVFLQIFAGVIGAIAGVLFANLLRVVTPRHFSFGLLISIYCFFFVGGSSTMWGLIIFTPILWGFPLLLPENIAVWKDSVYGVLLVVTMLLRPEGVITKKLINSISMNMKRILRRKGGLKYLIF